MKVITAIEKFTERIDKNDVCCFLAGGITNCAEWQDEVLDLLKDEDDHLIVFNPRRKNFPIDDPTASFYQIKWEFNHLSNCDIFSMYFDGTEQSDQPICFYELGKYLTEMKYLYTSNWEDRIVISCNSNFKRSADVTIQTMLASKGKIKINNSDDFNELNEMHANSIKNTYRKLKGYI